MGKPRVLTFTFVLKQLEDDGKLQIKGSSVSQQNRQVVLNPEQDKAREEILQLIRKTDLQPPRLDELLKKLPYEPWAWCAMCISSSYSKESWSG